MCEHLSRHTTGRYGETCARRRVSRPGPRRSARAGAAPRTRGARGGADASRGSLAAVLGGHAQALAFPRRARVGAGPRRGVLRVDRRQGDRGPQHRHRVRRRGDRRRQRDVPGLRRHRTHRGRYVVGISHRPIFSRIVARSHGSGGLSKTFCVFFQSWTRAARLRSSPFPARAPRAEAKRLPPRASLSVPLTNPNPNPNPKPKPNRTREGDALVRCPANLAFAVPPGAPNPFPAFVPDETWSRPDIEPPAGDGAARALDEGADARTFHENGRLAQEFRAALVLLHERSLGAASRWAPYLAHLPASTTC